ncbi:MAG: class I SAM-dependent methyltransferase [Candidatus Pelagadaptatus aseana]|uniref:SAM-dependent methyltransferase n=1 Tax=Candidatus Pelagadaptatus aseana TaxID=3120508 RepID=UPI0039B23BA7
MNLGEFYDLAELPLNTPGQAWGNLGYWHNCDDYSGACREMALLLGARVGLTSSSVVLDAGFGCGDQLLLWLQQFRVQRLFGVNYSRSQTAYAGQRIRQAQLASRADLRQGCVGRGDIWAAASGQSVDRVVALDCAYHFPSRAEFLKRSSELLPAGGRMGLTDFVLGEGYTGAAALVARGMFRLSQIPGSNMVSQQTYHDDLAGAGFGAIEFEDISAHVMPAFRFWLQQFRSDNPALMPRRRWLKYEATARFLDWAYEQQLLRYVVVTADKTGAVGL